MTKTIVIVGRKYKLNITWLRYLRVVQTHSSCLHALPTVGIQTHLKKD